MLVSNFHLPSKCRLWVPPAKLAIVTGWAGGKAPRFHSRRILPSRVQTSEESSPLFYFRVCQSGHNSKMGLVRIADHPPATARHIHSEKTRSPPSQLQIIPLTRRTMKDSREHTLAFVPPSSQRKGPAQKSKNTSILPAPLMVMVRGVSRGRSSMAPSFIGPHAQGAKICRFTPVKGPKPAKNGVRIGHSNPITIYIQNR